MFPGNLLEPNHPDPSNPTQLLGRSEVNRREKYFEHLERKLQESAGYPLVGMVKQCLKNIPQERPTAEQLVRTLDELKGDIEGPCGELTTMDAARQVKTTMALKKRSREQVDEVIAMEGEIQQLQQQLQVFSFLYVSITILLKIRHKSIIVMLEPHPIFRGKYSTFNLHVRSITVYTMYV